MRPVFVLTPPRARTCWLTVYLKGRGIPAVHEGWKYWPTPALLRLAMEAMGPGLVVNVDSGNPLHFDEIEAEFPEARYVCIYRNWTVCMQSLGEAFGREFPDATVLGEQYAAAQERVASRCFAIDFDDWTPEVSRSLIAWLDPTLPIDPVWDYFLAGLDIQLFPARLQAELDSLNTHKIVTIGG